MDHKQRIEMLERALEAMAARLSWSPEDGLRLIEVAKVQAIEEMFLDEERGPELIDGEIMTIADYCEMTGKEFSDDVILASSILQAKGYLFCGHFGCDNAVEFAEMVLSGQEIPTGPPNKRKVR